MSLKSLPILASFRRQLGPYYLWLPQANATIRIKSQLKLRVSSADLAQR
jgi:hypothetical protein